MAGWCLLKNIMQGIDTAMEKLNTHRHTSQPLLPTTLFERQQVHVIYFSQCSDAAATSGRVHSTFVKNLKNLFLRSCAPHYATQWKSGLDMHYFFFNVKCFQTFLYCSIFARAQDPRIIKFAPTRAGFAVCRKMCSQARQFISMLPHSCN